MSLPVKLQAARYAATDANSKTGRPYLLHLLAAIDWREDPSVPTIGVDHRWRGVYNAKFIEETPDAELAGVLLHEVGHLMREHHNREFTEFYPDHHRANIAQDICINQDLRTDGIKLPGFCAYPEGMGNYKWNLPANETWETYYHLLPDDVKTHEVGAGSCGKCAGGRGEAGDGNDPRPGIDPDEQKRIIDATEKSMKEAGKEAGSARSVAARLRNQRLRLRRACTSVLDGAGADTHTWSRPHRRSASFAPMLRPATRSLRPKLAVVLDTSGSLTDDMLSVLRGVALDLAKQADIRIYPADVQAYEPVRPETLRRACELAGGGGTDMGAAVLQVAERRPTPDGIVVLTDGYTPWSEAPKMPVSVVLIGKGGDAPAWAADTIYLDED